MGSVNEKELLLKRVFGFLEDGDFEKADEYCEKLLDLDVECSEAYLGKLLAELRVRRLDELQENDKVFEKTKSYHKLMQFASEELKETLVGYNESAKEKSKTKKKKKKKLIITLSVIVSIAVAILIVLNEVIVPVTIPAIKRKGAIKKYGEEFVVTLENAKRGDNIYFGEYEQDNDDINGKEKIVWHVLEREGDKVRIISVDVLDCKPYDTGVSAEQVLFNKNTKATWETSTIRTWLNEEFFNEAFSSEDKRLIYSAEGGDKIRLLSIDDAETFFPYKDGRKSFPTIYAEKKGVEGSEEGYCRWWLESDERGGADAGAVVTPDGSIIHYFGKRAVAGVSPVIWIKLSWL